MKEKILYEYGKKILDEDNNIIKNRKIINIYDLKFYRDLEVYIKNNDTNLVEDYVKKNIFDLLDLLDLIKNKDIINPDITIVKRFYNENDNYYMGWHFDDRQFIVQKIKNKDKLHDLEIINITNLKIYALYNKNKLPIFTVIIYFDSYNIDFTGGEVEFINFKYLPLKGDLLFFDSRDLHKVNKLNKGIRKCIVIKIYV
jgi:hypothetical protein